MKPLIGITLDYEEDNKYSAFPWYASRKNYADAVIKAGGIPIFIPHQINLVDEYIKKIEGLIITGGNFDISPNMYGEKILSSRITLKKNRTKFEFKITEVAIKNNLALLGICGGQQLLNVVYGGNLIQHIPDKIITKIDHEQVNPRNEPSHKVHIEENTKLRTIINSKTMFVNSAHHQAVDNIGKGITINAYADDGIIEGIEDSSLNFCIGVQWHPEFLIDKNDKNIFKELVNAGKN